ncbi:hypothetical protein [Crocinitomix catalasitica]|uniref:hypothetical protein n=1 Tax=Crocinitomix catalasitica TaxID=184607 RepID=UPI00048711E1|nr:hypothetical protein [Crocinitomix catalasitica]
MSIGELFETGGRKKDRSHFRNMILIAKADGVVSDEECKLLHKMGHKIGLNEDQINEIIENPRKLAIQPPVDRHERFEQIIELVKMVHADGKIGENEEKVLERVAVGIGYKSLDDVDVESILALILRGEPTEVIMTELG